MHRPKAVGFNQHDALVDLYACIADLDRAALYIEIPGYVELRKQLLTVYFDAYAELGRPFDQDAEPA